MRRARHQPGRRYRSCLEQIQPRTPHRRSEPSSVRAAAERAVKKLGWTKPWHVDADHIRLETVDRFLPAPDDLTSAKLHRLESPLPMTSARRATNPEQGRKRSTVSRRI